MKKLLFLLLTFSLFTQLQAGGPWPQPAGSGYFKLSEWWIVFDQHYTDAGLIDPNVTTGIFNTTFYGEYGLTDRLTVIANAPIFSRSYNNNIVSGTTGEVIQAGEAINGIGDIDLGIKYGLNSPGSTYAFSASLFLGLPTGEAAGGSQGNLQTGDGEFNQLLQFDVGRSFKIGQLPAYSSAYAGVNNRSKGFSEEFRYGVELGVNLVEQKLWLTGRLNVVESFKNGDTAETINSSSIFANNTEFSSVGLEASYYINNSWGISAGMAGAFRGEIIAAAPSYTVGVFYDFK